MSVAELVELLPWLCVSFCEFFHLYCLRFPAGGDIWPCFLASFITIILSISALTDATASAASTYVFLWSESGFSRLEEPLSSIARKYEPLVSSSLLERLPGLRLLRQKRP